MPRGIPRNRPAVSHAPAAALRIPADHDEPMLTAPEAAPARPELRTAMREEDPRTRAKRRADELRGHLGDLDAGVDQFHVAETEIPDGWTYEWKRRTVMGAEDPAYQVQLANGGWEAVPADRHPAYMPVGYKGGTIERGGMVLMERPKEITDEVRNIERKRARDQVRAKEEQLGAAPPGQFERQNKGDALANVKKSYEAIPIPEA